MNIGELKSIIINSGLSDDAEIVVWFDKSISEDTGTISDAHISDLSQNGTSQKVIIGSPALHINVTI